MGFSSWLTCDTRESVYNKHSQNYKPVYLLLPNDKSVMLSNYDGYHSFECDNETINIYEWLFTTNFGHQDGLNNNLMDLGISCYVGKYFLAENGDIYADGAVSEIMGLLNVDNVFKYHDYFTPMFIDNEMISIRDKLDKEGFKIFRLNDLIQIDLKFSFNPNAKYSELPKSEDCPRQGFF